jgi:ADP-ribosylglycohydrolase
MASLTIEDRVYGCLLGSAVGDALGAPTECMDYRDIRRFLIPQPSGSPRRGAAIRETFHNLAIRPRNPGPGAVE